MQKLAVSLDCRDHAGHHVVATEQALDFGLEARLLDDQLAELQDVVEAAFTRRRKCRDLAAFVAHTLTAEIVCSSLAAYTTELAGFSGTTISAIGCPSRTM
jgi:hypothetical protein